MKLNGSTDYAVKTLLFLQKTGRKTTAQEISKGMNIPPKYLPAILKTLRENGYVRSFQGSNGGFALTPKSRNINLYDVIRLMEGEILSSQCSTCTSDCLLHNGDDKCPVSSAYEAMRTSISETARSITIQQISTYFSRREFAVYYQPIVCAKKGTITGAEALARRIMPGGVMLPEHFVPVLERTGNITRLDQFVAGEVSNFIRSRHEKGLPIVPVAVNIAQSDFYDPVFMENLASLLEDPTLPKGSIILELTETTYAQQEKQHEAYIESLCKNGAQIIMDDFGSGYSSFSALNRYFFKKLKIDRSFIARLCDNHHVQVAVDSIINMCHKLEISVVAEGVESKEQLELLRQMDCDYIQGFYFSPPLNETLFSEYLNQSC